MKALDRSCDAVYHEGERVKAMIETLDFGRIIAKAPIGLGRAWLYTDKLGDMVHIYHIADTRLEYMKLFLI